MDDNAKQYVGETCQETCGPSRQRIDSWLHDKALVARERADGLDALYRAIANVTSADEEALSKLPWHRLLDGERSL